MRAFFLARRGQGCTGMPLEPARKSGFRAALVFRHRWFRRGVFLMVAAVSEVVSGGRTLAAPACPADCDGSGSVVHSELTDAVRDVLTPSNAGAPTRCPAVDADRDGDYGVEDLIRGATARGVGCVWVVSPAGWRGAAVDGLTGQLHTGVTVFSNRWPLPFAAAQDPEWAWPRSSSGTPTPTPEREIHSTLDSPPFDAPGTSTTECGFRPSGSRVSPGYILHAPTHTRLAACASGKAGLRLAGVLSATRVPGSRDVLLHTGMHRRHRAAGAN